MTERTLLALSSLLTAIATCAIATFAFWQYSTMQATEKILDAQQSFMSRPIIQISGADQPDKAPQTRFTIDEGEEVWGLLLALHNKGTSNAYGLEYFHLINVSERFPPINDSAIQKRFAEEVIIFAFESYNPTIKMVTKKQIQAWTHDKKDIYRHAYIRFEDEFGREYQYAVSWKMSPYLEGEIPQWGTVRYRDLVRNPF